MLVAPSPQELHVWMVSLDLATRSRDALLRSLDESELARARRFHFPVHGERFIAARGSLRHILAGYLDVGPAELRFCYNAHGKPSLEPGGLLRFNLSHSGSWGLLGVAWGREVGVDIEAIRGDWSFEEVADRFFSPAECGALAALPRDGRTRGFFRVWTRKEAYIKARGRGVSMGLDTFDVSCGAEEGPSLLATRPDADDATRWWVGRLLGMPDGFEGAAALERLEGPSISLRVFEPFAPPE